jgi:hypothetical protein
MELGQHFTGPAAASLAATRKLLLSNPLQQC